MLNHVDAGVRAHHWPGYRGGGRGRRGGGAVASASSPSVIPLPGRRLPCTAPLPGTVAPFSIGSGEKKPFSIPQITELQILTTYIKGPCSFSVGLP